MIISEDEAKKSKICPLTLMNAQSLSFQCRGADCMIWVWQDSKSWRAEHPNLAMGFCGLCQVKQYYS